MSTISNHEYFSTDQYRDASNLNARIQLHARFSTNKYDWHRWVFDQFDLQPESRILELGCGAGHLWVENLNRIPADWDVLLSDLSLGMLQEAQRNLCNSQRDFQLAVIDAQAIPFARDTLSAVIANHMLYHVPDRMKALSEIGRVLRPGGRFYASTVGRTHLRELGELLSQFDPTAHFWPEVEQPKGFVLENAFDELSRWFSAVTLHRHEDSLAITEADPLVAYVASTTARFALAGRKVEEFTEFVEQQIALRSVIHITKDTGMFACIRP